MVRVKKIYSPIKIGERFGKLVVLKESLIRCKNGNKRYLCKCDCGVTKEIKGASLRQGVSKSCNCEFWKNAKGNHKKDIGESSYNSLESEYKIRARKKKLPFELTREQFRNIIKQNCYWCGSETVAKNRYLSRVKNSGCRS